MDSNMICRFCQSPLKHTFVDLGMQPLANSYVDRERAEASEAFYPLHARVCEQCFLVQLPELASPEEIFSEYAYLSSVSTTWLQHYARLADAMADRFHLGANDLVVEVASNDGGLLRCFKQRGIRVLGIEPARNIAALANRDGVETIAKFFGAALAADLVEKAPKLILANNVLAHVPDINDFVAGFRTLLARDGVLSVEFPHLAELISKNQFDTIYHEHFSYLSLGTVAKVFARNGLRVFDVEQLPTHGGSLRVIACHDGAGYATSARVNLVLGDERAAGLTDVSTYARFAQQVHATKQDLLELMIREKRLSKKIVGYGAPAKGNTLLNYCGIRGDFLDFTCDRSPLKQGKLLPGTRIPIESPDAIRAARPDLVLILPWNIDREIIEQLAYIREWGGRFIVPIPRARVVE